MKVKDILDRIIVDGFKWVTIMIEEMGEIYAEIKTNSLDIAYKFFGEYELADDGAITTGDDGLILFVKNKM